MKNRKLGVILLAGGSVSHKLPFLMTRSSCPALIPVGIKTVISHQLEFYSRQVDLVLVMCANTEVEAITNELYCDDPTGEGFPTVDIVGCNTATVVETMKCAAEQINKISIDDWIVTVSTTIPSKMPNADTVMLSDKLDCSSEWSSILPKDSHTEYYPKGREMSSNAYAFTGVFRLQKDVLTQAVKQSATSDLLEVVQKASLVKSIKFDYCDWIDVGHAINFYGAKSKLTASRSFNSIQIDPEFGILTKTSRNVCKFLDELKYVEMLPADLKHLFPRMLSGVQLSEESASVKMEYYAYPTLAELALFWDLDLAQWRRCFNTIGKVLQEFGRHKYQIGYAAHVDFYWRKLEARINDFMNQLPKEVKTALSSDEILINGKLCRNFNLIASAIKDAIEKMYNIDHFCAMHGDLCFNNILYEPYSGTIKLIDSRGSFGPDCVGIYGDAKYDIAKLAHSAVYNYDYFVAGLYDLNLNNGEFSYGVRVRQNSEIIKRCFYEMLRKIGIDAGIIDCIVGMLFLSMPPLHNDDMRRQIAMYLHGLVIINKGLLGDENLH